MKLHLSLPSWLFLAFLGGISIYLVVRNPSDILLLPGFFLPPILVLHIFYFRRLRKEISLDVVVANFACGFLPGAIIVVVAEALIALSLFLFFFSDQLQVGSPLPSHLLSVFRLAFFGDRLHVRPPLASKTTVHTV